VHHSVLVFSLVVIITGVLFQVNSDT